MAIYRERPPRRRSKPRPPAGPQNAPRTPKWVQTPQGRRKALLRHLLLDLEQASDSAQLMGLWWLVDQLQSAMTRLTPTSTPPKE